MLLASADVSPMFSLLALMLVGVVAVSLVSKMPQKFGKSPKP